MSGRKGRESMKKSGRKLLALALCLALCAGLLTGTALAAETVDSGSCGADGDNVTWTLDSDGVLTISGTGAMADYSTGEVPWYSWDGGPVRQAVIRSGVTSIGKWLFFSCSNLTSITIPDSVTSIGNYAFSNCSGLTDITIPDSVTSIGEFAFSGCLSLTSVTIPDSVTSIGEGAFYYCSSLTSVTIPDSLTSTGWFTFEYCSSLKNVTIPNSVTSIGEGTFYSCSSLTSVFLPSSLTTVETGAFRDCSALADVYYAGSEAAWSSIVIGDSNEALISARWHFGVEPVSILSSPANVTVPAGNTATFKVTATGATGYQWQASTDGGKTWANSGANGNKTATLSFTAAAAHNGYRFRCVVKSSSGQSVTSNAATLTVGSAGGPTITGQPANVSVTAGSTVTFKVTATGATSYQWQASTDGGKTWKNSGASGNKTATLSFTAAAAHNGYRFRCVVKGSGGQSVTSNAATLTIGSAGGPTITGQPANVSATAGSTVTFKVTATGATSYQWQVSTNGGATWVNSGANGNKTATLSFTAAAAHNGYKFRCVVTGSGGQTVTSNAAVLTMK